MRRRGTRPWSQRAQPRNRELRVGDLVLLKNATTDEMRQTFSVVALEDLVIIRRGGLELKVSPDELSPAPGIGMRMTSVWYKR